MSNETWCAFAVAIGHRQTLLDCNQSKVSSCLWFPSFRKVESGLWRCLVSSCKACPPKKHLDRVWCCFGRLPKVPSLKWANFPGLPVRSIDVNSVGVVLLIYCHLLVRKENPVLLINHHHPHALCVCACDVLKVCC